LARLKDEELNPRTCIATREPREADEMIRFVLGPDRTVTPDLKRNLPGRGAWVTATRETVELAVQQRAFHKAFGAKVNGAPELTTLTERLLLNECEGLLGFARKAGLALSGQEKVEQALRQDDVLAIIAVKGSQTASVRKVHGLVRMVNEEYDLSIEQFEWPDMVSLDRVFDRGNVRLVALLKGGVSAKLVRALERLRTWHQAAVA